MKKKIFSLLLAMILSPVVVFAEPPSVPGLKHQVDQLTVIVKGLQEELAKTQTELAATQNELAQIKRNTVLGLDGLLLLAQDAEGHDTALFSGVNLQLVNGAGATESPNGFGNLVIGYNANNGVYLNRLGSHNVVVGDGQSYPNTQEVVTGKILSNRNLAISVANDLHTIVGSDQFTSVGNDRTVETGRNNSESIGKTTSVTVGSDADISVGKDMELSVGEDTALIIARDAEISVGSTATVDAGDELLVQSGKASSSLKKNGAISVNGKDITIKATGQIDIKAAGDLALKGARILQN
jgi:hypothetical protein